MYHHLNQFSLYITVGGSVLTTVTYAVSGFCLITVLMMLFSRMMRTCMLPVSIVIVSSSLVVSTLVYVNVSRTVNVSTRTTTLSLHIFGSFLHALCKCH